MRALLCRSIGLLLIMLWVVGSLRAQPPGRFGDDIEIAPSGNQFHPRLVVRSTGELYAGFFVGDEGTASVFRSSDGGNSWSQFFRLNWDSLGAVVNDMDMVLAEGDSACLFLAFSLTYGGAGVERLAVVRANLTTGAEGLVYVQDYSSPALIRSPRLAADDRSYPSYRVRVAWIRSGATGDSIFYATSANTGILWTTPSLSYSIGGGMNHLSFAYGNNLWWVAWDRNDKVYAKDLFTSSAPKLLTPGNYPHFRPVLAIAETLNSRGGTTMTAAFVRRWSTDLGCIYVYSTNGGQNWSSVDSPLGSDEQNKDEFNPFVSYSRRAGKFFFSYIARDVQTTNRAYRIRVYSTSADNPITVQTVSARVNDDSTSGSGNADPVLHDNPLLPNAPMVVWRHWPGSGDGRIRFDGPDRPTVIVCYPTEPVEYGLSQNYPNPFNPSTVIKYGLPKESAVTLHVYSLLGQQVATLANGSQLAGFYEAQWDGKNSSGGSVSSGVYFFRIEAIPADGASPFIQIRKMVMLK